MWVKLGKERGFAVTDIGIWFVLPERIYCSVHLNDPHSCCRQRLTTGK